MPIASFSPSAAGRLLLAGLLTAAGAAADPPANEPAPASRPFAERSLAEELGHPPGTRLLIVNADDAGLCEAVDRATLAALDAGWVTSATVLVPAPGAREFVAAARERDFDVGVHLCLNGEWGTRVEFRPVTQAERVPSLVNPGGLLWPSNEERDRHARPAEAAVELRAQLACSREWGLDPSHFDGHMGCYNYRPDLLRVGLGLARESDLPLRVALFGAEARRRGLVCPDRFAMFYDDPVERRRETYLRFFRTLAPGVTELAVHLAEDTPEWRALDPEQHALRVSDREILADPEVRRCLDEERIVRIGWRPLRELQRRWTVEGKR